MDVLVTLKINDLNGNLLYMARQPFFDDIGYNLDEFIERYGEHVEEYLLNKIEVNGKDCGEVILRYSYLALADEFADEADELDEADGSDNADELMTSYEDGVIMYDAALTNERVIVRFGTLRLQYIADGETSAE